MKDETKDKILDQFDKNVNFIKDTLKGNSDIIMRTYNINNIRVFLMVIDGLGNKTLLDQSVLEMTMKLADKITVPQDIEKHFIAATDMHKVATLTEGFNATLSGDSFMLIEGVETGYVIATRDWSSRGVGEPNGENIIRGAREGFTESLRTNTALIRRRVRDTRLKIEGFTIGKRSKTDTAIVYINDVVNEKALTELKKRIDKIDIDAILDSGYVENFIQDTNTSFFPQIQSTERADVVAAALYEGRIAIVVDNGPFVLIVPATLPCFFQSPDDYYGRWMNASILRFLRMFCVIISLILPALYIAAISYNIMLLPSRLAYSLASTRIGVPFPPYIEVLIMEFSMVILIEAILRMPKNIGSTIGIVGGLVIGSSAVSAGIVSPLMIIIVALTALTTFITPNYEITNSLRILRIVLIVFSAMGGMYGIFIGLVVILVHLLKLRSFGISYLAPVIDPTKDDMKDLFVRIPWNFMKTRPDYLKNQDKIRQK